MLKKIVLWAILTSLLVQTSTTLLQHSFLGNSQRPLVLVIVHSSIYTTVEPSLEQYATDIENEGFSVIIIESRQLQNETPQDIRSLLQNLMNDNLVGALFVGDIPGVWIQVGDETILTDMYYKDLNGSWLDSDGDGVYDEHSGDVTPEIWVGRLKASPIAADEAPLVNNYFAKNHNYRNGLLVLPWWRSLAYIDDYGLNWTQETELSLSEVYSEVTLVTDPAITTARDYESRLEDPFGYEWIYLMCHGSYDFHTFRVPEEQNPSSWDGTVFSWQYCSIDPRAFFYLFFVCSATEYTKSGYLAGSAIFADTYGLLAIGSTTDMFSFSSLEFFSALSEGKTIGDAFQIWFLQLSQESNGLQEKSQYQTIFYGLTIVGDPTLKLYRKENVLLHDISITNVTTELRNTEDELRLSVTVTIENIGSFPETFDFTISAGSHRLKRVRLSLSPKASTTVKATVPQSYRITPVDSSKITVKTTASILPEEFNGGDNEQYTEVRGVHLVSLAQDFSPYPLIFVFIMLIVCLRFLYKMLASERPPLLKQWIKMKNSFTHTFSRLRNKTNL